MNHNNTHTQNTLINKCYEQLQNHIINGTLAPGKKLKVRELKELLHVGASPIREALSRLTTSGLVQAIDNKGFRVAPISEHDIRDVYHTFLEIELLALCQAMKLGDDAWKTSIVATLYNLSLIEINHHTISVEEWIKRNYEFHWALIAGCNSPALLELRSHIYRKFDRYCRMSFTIIGQKLETNYHEHKKLADAVLRRDKNTAIKIMTHHILGSLENVIHMLKTQNILF